MSPIKTEDIVKAITAATTGIAQISTIMPTLTAAYAVLHGIWQKANPEGTFAEFNAYLLEEATNDVTWGISWMALHGYIKDENGNWVKAPIISV